MRISEIFKKDIARPINGVVKADQLDDAIVWQELDEYVVTRELDQHLRKFIAAWLHAADNAHDPVSASRIGVWVSGFFGSGKSHFIKILSYLLGNREAAHPDTGARKRAVDFFDQKINDPMLLGDLKRAAAMDAEVVLFNIDSKADAGAGRTAVLSTFWRVFNESRGFCGEYLQLAEMERYLAQKGKYDIFKEAFRERTGAPWEEERDAYQLNREVIEEVMAEVLGKSARAVNDWFERSESDFNLTVENFAKRVKEHLDARPGGRIVFLVDEMGQFIGQDVHLMLNLQTIVEDLGRLCNGRVWTLVTSQEDIDAVLGDVKSSKANDFSKIQGRFTTRLSLSSSNTDEVIQARLLQKTGPARTELDELFHRKGDILRSQLGFSHDSATLKNFADAHAFTANYPFAPFHFQLLQSIFESIRKAGATGLHLARGERSMLDAFQSAAKSLSTRETGALAPLHGFFPCIENFLDTAVILSINNARDNRDLQMPFDLHLLQTLFLIRYVEIVKPNVDNLVTLRIDRVDADRIDLKQRVEASLERLEKQNLINRNGDLYFFLTNDEREVSREIKSVSIPPAAESRLLAEIIFDEILKGKTKHRYKPYNNDYPFNRMCDNRSWGKEMKDELGLEIISPLHDDYPLFIPAKCNLYSANKEGSVVVKLEEDPTLFPAIRAWLQTHTYIKAKSDAAASPNLKQILRNRAEENRARRERLTALVDALLSRAEYYALGRELNIKGQSTAKALEDAFDHLVQNVFSKYVYLTRQYEEPVKEIKQILRSDDVARRQLVLEFEKGETPDIAEIRIFLDLKTAGNQPVLLSELIRRFSRRPYGWGALQTAALTARMYIAGTISLMREGDRLKPGEALAPLTRSPQWKTVKLVKRKITTANDIKRAQALGKELFGAIAPDGQDPLAQYLREGLARWRGRLGAFQPLADTGAYPGKREIDACLALAEDLSTVRDAYELVRVFNDKKEDLRDARDDLDDLEDFYTNQKSVWETLRKALDRFNPNGKELERDPAAQKALDRMSRILSAPQPYGMLKEVSALVSRVDAVNNALIEEKREIALQEIDAEIQGVSTQLKDHGADPDFGRRTLAPLREVAESVRRESSIPRIITYRASDAPELAAEALKAIDDAFNPSPDPDPEVREVKTIKPAALKQKPYLDTEEDIDEFIARLKAALLEAVKAGMKVRVE